MSKIIIDVLLYAVGAIVLYFILLSICKLAKRENYTIIERHGKYIKTVKPGLFLTSPFSKIYVVPAITFFVKSESDELQAETMDKKQIILYTKGFSVIVEDPKKIYKTYSTINKLLSFELTKSFTELTQKNDYDTITTRKPEVIETLKDSLNQKLQNTYGILIKEIDVDIY